MSRGQTIYINVDDDDAPMNQIVRRPNERDGRTNSSFINVNHFNANVYYPDGRAAAMRRRVEHWQNELSERERANLQRVEQEDEKQDEKEEKKKVRVPLSKRVINVADDDSVPRVLLPVELATILKTHQLEGVRFCWKHIVTAKTDELKGCILAHSMGLGKVRWIVCS